MTQQQREESLKDRRAYLETLKQKQRDLNNKIAEVNRQINELLMTRGLPEAAA